MESGFEAGMLNFRREDASPLDLGFGHFSCSQYRRRCKIRATCCDEIFDCRHCHNEAKVICPCVAQNKMFSSTASIVGFAWGSIFAPNATSLMMIFLSSSTIAMNVESAELEGRRISSICNRCGCCYSILLKDSHNCVERAMHHNCPVCFDFLFDTTKDITVLPCGHTIHLECVKEMERHFQYACPVCSKSYCDMSRVWEKLDQEVASTPMPQMYENKMVWILCNDCGETSEVIFHIVAHKCLRCNSYNTRQTGGSPTSCSSGFEEM